MDKKTNEEWQVLIEQAVAGDKAALEEIVLGVQDKVFNFSLRMLGTFADAEDATQDILLKVVKHLADFRGESAFTTWVMRIAANDLKTYKKHMFAQMPLSFEFYGADIENGVMGDIPDQTQGVDQDLLAEELKMACTNVLLQCLDAESRAIFILGTMFRADSRLAGEILGLTPEAYRQRLSRIRRKVADFLQIYCGAYGHGSCCCYDRVNYAIQSHRLHPGQMDYTQATIIDRQKITIVKEAMEEIDDLAGYFAFCKCYQTPTGLQKFLQDFLQSSLAEIVRCE